MSGKRALLGGKSGRRDQCVQGVQGVQGVSERQAMQELEQEQLELSQIQLQRDLVDRVQLSLQRKDHELQRLSALVDKYRPYYEQHNEAKLELADREGAVRALAKENQLLRKEFDQLLRESSEVAAQLRQAETEKQGLLRERHVFERVNREIEATFKEYQAQCRQRERELTAQLQQAHAEHQATAAALAQTQTALALLQAEPQEKSQFREELQGMQTELAEKERELQKNKMLNHELSVEFDKAVSKIGEFERELNEYRRENHELKKTLGLVLEQEKFHKLHQKYLRSSHGKDQQEEEEEEEDSSLGSSPSMSQAKF